MKKSTKAALFSALIFPGAGHFVLRRWVRGLLFMATALWATGLLVTDTLDRSLEAVDRILSGEVGMDAASIEAYLEQEQARDRGLLLAAAGYVLMLCWAGAIVDAYYLGKRTSG